MRSRSRKGRKTHVGEASCADRPQAPRRTHSNAPCAVARTAAGAGCVTRDKRRRAGVASVASSRRRAAARPHTPAAATMSALPPADNALYVACISTPRRNALQDATRARKKQNGGGGQIRAKEHSPQQPGPSAHAPSRRPHTPRAAVPARRRGRTVTVVGPAGSRRPSSKVDHIPSWGYRLRSGPARYMKLHAAEDL